MQAALNMNLEQFKCLQNTDVPRSILVYCVLHLFILHNEFIVLFLRSAK